ncbi:hypothetical protein U1Q18_001120, partial [Sarracenia purpurea var. burkii]
SLTLRLGFRFSGSRWGDRISGSGSIFITCALRFLLLHFRSLLSANFSPFVSSFGSRVLDSQ